MPSNFDAKAYAAECRGMDNETLIKAIDAGYWRIVSEVRCDSSAMPNIPSLPILGDELRRRLNPGRVDRKKLAEMMRESNCATLLLSESHELGAWFADLVESGKLPREGE